MQPVTYSGNQSVNYLDTNISTHNDVCKQLDICQENLHEEHGQKGQEKLNKSSPRSKQLSQEVAQQSQQSQRERNNNVATVINIGNIGCVRKENKFVSPKTLKCSVYQKKDIDSEQNPKIGPSSYINRILHKRRKHRQIRHSDNSLLSYIRRLPRQNTTVPYEIRFFNGSNFY